MLGSFLSGSVESPTSLSLRYSEHDLRDTSLLHAQVKSETVTLNREPGRGSAGEQLEFFLTSSKTWFSRKPEARFRSVCPSDLPPASLLILLR
jgi:hypothetical protein